MKIRLEIDVPEFEWIEVDAKHDTPMGEVCSIEEVERVGDFIEYLKILPDISWVINADHDHIRVPLLCELIKRNLKFIPNELVALYADKLGRFLAGFRRGTGYDFKDYSFNPKVLTKKKRIKFESFNMLFDDEESALRHIAKIHVSQKNFEFEKILDKGGLF